MRVSRAILTAAFIECPNTKRGGYKGHNSELGSRSLVPANPLHSKGASHFLQRASLLPLCLFHTCMHHAPWFRSSYFR
jgi:hypothetical protein